MGTGVGKYCKRCGEQLNYDDGFENGFCSRCLCIEGFEKGVIKGRFEALPITKKLLSERTFTKKELEILLYLVKSRDRDMNRMWVRKKLPDYEIEVSRNLVKKLEDLSKLRQ